MATNRFLMKVLKHKNWLQALKLVYSTCCRLKLKYVQVIWLILLISKIEHWIKLFLMFFNWVSWMKMQLIFLKIAFLQKYWLIKLWRLIVKSLKNKLILCCHMLIWIHKMIGKDVFWNPYKEILLIWVKLTNNGNKLMAKEYLLLKQQLILFVTRKCTFLQQHLILQLLLN